MTGRLGLMRRAAGTAFVGNALLGAMKITLGLRSGSVAVTGDGIDSSLDVLIAVVSLIVVKVIARPADEGHPWGHGRAEAVASAFFSFLLFFAGSQLIVTSALRLLHGEAAEAPGAEALAASLVSVVGKTLLAANQYWLGKKAGSAMLRANAKNMAADAALSGGVLAGVALSIELSLGYLDSWAAILVGLWVIRSAIGIFVEANRELMDGAGDAASYQALYDAVRAAPGAGNPHRARMRRIAGLWDIDLDIEVDPSITVMAAHGIAQEVEKAIKERVEGVYDIVVHVEPAGNVEREGFGLRERQ